MNLLVLELLLLKGLLCSSFLVDFAPKRQFLLYSTSDDDYGLFDLNRDLDDEMALQYDGRIGQEKDVQRPSRFMARKIALEKPQTYRDSMLGVVGETEIDTNNKYLMDIKDAIDRRRGSIATYTRKGMDTPKRGAPRPGATINIPDFVYMVIRNVYIERTMKLSEFKKLYPLPSLEFKKWVQEQKKKSKKDVLMMAKIEVSKKWLMRPPGETNIASSYKRKGYLLDFSMSIQKKVSKDKLPPVVMDELTAPLRGVTFVSNSGGAAKIPAPAAVNSASISATASAGAATVRPNAFLKFAVPPTVITRSMIEWDQPISAEEANLAVAGETSINSGSEKQFVIDGVEMFVPNACKQTEYFVVL